MEDFYGHDLDKKLIEVRGLKIDPAHRANEPALMTRRWFDYRDMHPVLATYLYAHHYKEQTARYYEAMVDIRTPERARAFTPDDIFMSRDLTSMWLARASADRLSLPYPFVMRFAQARFFERAQRQFPRPNQLYGEEFEVDLLAAWKEQIGRQLTYASSPRYKAHNWCGQLAQAQHVRFVVEQVKARPAPRHRLIARLMAEDVLSYQQAASNFGAQEADAAETYRKKFFCHEEGAQQSALAS